MSDAMVKAEWTSEQKELIKRTVATEATDSELAMFLHIAAKAGLDPLQKQIHFTKRQGRVTVIAGIDGLQARASREPDFEGILSGVVCQKDDFEFDATVGKVVKHTYNAFGDRGPIKGAWATVQRKGKLPFTAMVRFEEFNQPASPTWKQMPSVMIAKVAKSTALRMAYPEQFGGIYERAEMDQADKDATPISRGPDAVKAALGLAPSPVVEAKALPSPESLMTADELRVQVMAMEGALEKKPNARNAPQVRAKLAALRARLVEMEQHEPGEDAPPPTDADFVPDEPEATAMF